MGVLSALRDYSISWVQASPGSAVKDTIIKECLAAVVSMSPVRTARRVGPWFRKYRQDLWDPATALGDGNVDLQRIRREAPAAGQGAMPTFSH
jgi:hypothetical protein